MIKIVVCVQLPSYCENDFCSSVELAKHTRRQRINIFQELIARRLLTVKCVIFEENYRPSLSMTVAARNMLHVYNNCVCVFDAAAL